jgi:hypothetical protein
MSTAATESTSSKFFVWLYDTVLRPLFVGTTLQIFRFIKPALGNWHKHEKECAYSREISPEISEPPSPTQSVFSSDDEHGVYDNPRLHPRNFLHGPLSHNPATRLRQMLARPGIVVSTYSYIDPIHIADPDVRLRPVSAMALVYAVLWKLVSRVSIRGRAP